MSRLRLLPALAAGLLAACLAASGAHADDVLVIVNAKIYAGDGKVIDGGAVVIRDGKISELVAPKAEYEPPYGATVVDAAGRALVPGLVVAHTWSGMDVPNDNAPVAPFVSTIDAIDPSSLFFASQLRNGVTTLGVYPGHGTAIGGKGAAIKLRSDTVNGMLLRRDIGLKVALGVVKRVRDRGGWRSIPTPRMQTLATIRKAFDDARAAKEKRDKALAAAKDEAAKAKVKAIDFKVAPLVAAMAGELPVVFSCSRPGDVHNAIELAKTYGLKGKLVLRETAFKASAAAKAAGMRVILDYGLEHREQDADSDRQRIYPIASLLRKAGHEVALSPRANDRSWISGHLWFQAANAIKWGLSAEDALASVTRWPAQSLGLGDRLGSIAVGKDADVVLLSGEPFRTRTFVEQVWIDGKSVYERRKDPWLERLYFKPKTAPSK